MDTIPAVVVASFVAGADCVHPAQKIRPTMRRTDRMRVRNGDIVIHISGKENKDFRVDVHRWMNNSL
jgi:hypothetical protein